MKAATLGLAAALVLGAVEACLADDLIAAEQVSGTSVGFVLKGSYSNATLTIAGPDNFHASTYSKGGAVAIDLSRYGSLPDGTYNYQLTAASSERIKAGSNDGRGSGREAFARKPAAKSGHFNVKRGRIVDYGTAEEPGTRDHDAR